jgi:hypothetical protein
MLIEYDQPARFRRAISFLFQKAESALSSFGPLAPARPTRAISSSANLSTPRGLAAFPVRKRMCSTSPVSARVAISGWYPRWRV